jgi:hypothetical protein
VQIFYTSFLSFVAGIFHLFVIRFIQRGAEGQQKVSRSSSRQGNSDLISFPSSVAKDVHLPIYGRLASSCRTRSTNGRLLIAPDALHSGSNRRIPLYGPWGGFGSPGLRRYPAPTHSAGTSSIARASGGDSTSVENASAFEDTLARIRERYALYFYLPDDVKPGEERAIEVDLSDAARRRYPGAEVRYRRSYLAPKDSGGGETNTSNDSPSDPTTISGEAPRSSFRISWCSACTGIPLIQERWQCPIRFSGC